MSSQLNVDTIVDKAGSGGVSLTQSPSLATPTLTGISSSSSATSEGGSNTTSLNEGLIKCWNQIDNASSPGIEDSFNTASLTDVAVGRRQINFTTAMRVATYPAAGSCQNFEKIISFDNNTTAKAESRIYGVDNTTNVDAQARNIICGDLA